MIHMGASSWLRRSHATAPCLVIWSGRDCFSTVHRSLVGVPPDHLLGFILVLRARGASRAACPTAHTGEEPPVVGISCYFVDEVGFRLDSLSAFSVTSRMFFASRVELLT